MAYMNLVLFGYAAIVLIGGIAGYASAKSTASLASSIPSAILIAIAGVVFGQNARLGLILGFVLSAALAVFFIYRLRKTKKIMPAAPMIVISDIVLLACAYYLVTRPGHG
jgi:uncharacterized membrane protein (UPF0136 family)